MNKLLAPLFATALMGLATAGCHRDEPQAPSDVSSFEANRPGSSSTASNTETRHDTVAHETTHHHEPARTVVVHEQPVIARCEICGTVTNVEEMHKAGDGSNAIGTIAGAVIGGVVGHQIGGGRGNTVATAAGAAGGAYAGNRAQAYHNRQTYYRITVSMEGGGTRVIESSTLNGVGVGSKVKVVGDALQPA